MSLGETYTVDEVAASLKVTPRWVRDQIKSGVIHPMRLNTTSRTAPYRLEDTDVEQLKLSLRPPAPVARKRRRRAA